MLGGSKGRWKEYAISEQNNRNVMRNTGGKEFGNRNVQ